MRPVTQVVLLITAAVFVAGLSIAILGAHAAAPADPRFAFQRFQAPTTRGECRNHQYIVIYTDAYGRERETDEGQFCDITE